MRLRLLISLNCLLLLAWQRAGAQVAPADDFFHGGARLYISNSIPQAKEVVEQGLKLYPNDEKLKKLEALLNQQQQQQQQNQQKQQSQQDKSDQQKKQDQQKQDEQKKNQSDQKNGEQKKQPDQQKKPEPEKDQADQPDKKEEGQPVKPGELTPEEAKHLLDAQKGDEQLLQLKPPEKPRNNSRPVKDW